MKTTETVKANEKIVVSGKNEIISEDFKKMAMNAAWFFSPLMLVFLGALQAGTPIKDALVLVYGGLLQILVDGLKKWKYEVKYVVEK